jgi:hypothetical protein
MRRQLAVVAASPAWGVGLVLVLLAAAVGCGGGAPEATVEGRVAYQGQPIAGGALTFYPASGRPITAPLSQDGAYSCRLPPGEYRVTVTVGVTLPPGWKEGDPVPPPAVVVPPRYGSRLETPLSATVPAEGGAQTVDFTLK